jgi:AcrR family transcriptional regulator
MVKKARLAETASSPEKPEDPRARIVSAAREVFIEQSFDLATVREITLRADVNLAAINYYFGSKDELISEVLNLMMEPYTNARLKALEACEAAAGENAPTIEAVVEALVRPMVRLSRDDSGARPLTRFLLQVRSPARNNHALLYPPGRSCCFPLYRRLRPGPACAQPARYLLAL